MKSWKPERTGTIDIRIAADGMWYHDGDPILRDAIQKLFATILRLDPDGYCLVTPAEKLYIEVEDVPFLAIDMEVRGRAPDSDLLFTTNMDDHVLVDTEHALRVAEENGRPRPYLHVRDGLEALLTRPVYYRLVDEGCSEGADYCVYSAGQRFVLGHT
ncbi:MAG: DUF1285 domain-containing protein [Gammaproteobacteria bacterium]|nr:DUF1285 domain-containing protein [Gammaproteobacteria bacterium]